MNNEIIDKVSNILSIYSLKLKSIKLKNDYGVKNIIEIVIKGQKTSNNQLEEIHYKIQDQIDDYIPDDGFLEVSFEGPEYQIETLEELKKHIGAYVFLKSDYYKGNCFIEKVDSDNIITFKYLVKNIKKEIKIKYNDKLFIETRVKV